MGKVSKRIMDTDIEERMFEIFWNAFAGIKSPEEAKKFWRSFISDVELLMLAKRLGIALMLSKGYLYQEIKDTLKVSSATIMSVVIRYRVGGKGLAPALQRILKNEKSEDFMDNIEEFLLMIAPPAKYGSSRHEKRQQEGLKIYKGRKKRAIL